MNILLVDDEPLVRKAFAKILQRDKHAVIEADCIARARELCDTEKIDLCITDIAMPDGSGAELIRYIRGHDRLKDTPIIVLSGFASESQHEIIALKPHAIYQKPVNIEDLRWAVNDALRV